MNQTGQHIQFVEVVRKTRYVALIPIVGLAIAASVLFVAGGFGLLMFLVQSITAWVTGRTQQILPVLGLLEHVDQFLIGTVLYITALGLYQLFIHELPMRPWLKVESGADLETNIVGVIVVVLAIEFLGAVFSGRTADSDAYNVGIPLTIVALAIFLGVRHWANGKSGTPQGQVTGQSGGQTGGQTGDQSSAAGEVEDGTTRLQ